MSAHGAGLQDANDMSTTALVPRNTKRLMFACILAQFAIGYGIAIDGIVPFDIRLPSDAQYKAIFFQIFYNMFTFGTIAVGIPLLVFGDNFGRKKVFALGLCITAISCIIQVSSFGPAQVYIRVRPRRSSGIADVQLTVQHQSGP